MRRIKIIILLLLSVSMSYAADRKALARTILQDQRLEQVDKMGHEICSKGLNAGDGYSEVWIRDFNTFITLAMEVMPDEKIQEALLTFFHFQEENGEIPDGYMDIRNVSPKDKGGFTFSKTEPRYAAHKNTVETDQESSLVQAIYRYVTKSGNKAFLQKEVNGQTVSQRLLRAMHFLMNERYDKTYGLIWGATTSDWGDVQPEQSWGVDMDENTHPAIDIYDNAFFLIALDELRQLGVTNAEAEYWKNVEKSVRKNVRKYLWDKKRQKFRPHVYLKGSPFPADFDEDRIWYHGGTAMAIEAGLLSKSEIRYNNTQMVHNVERAGAQSIGLTVYPVYPAGYFYNKALQPWVYQNGGDWTWFGARMITQLVRYGMVQEAYTEIGPMLDRVLKNKGFYEWYSREGKPSGSGTFRGSAGVLHTAILALQDWAKKQLGETK